MGCTRMRVAMRLALVSGMIGSMAGCSIDILNGGIVGGGRGDGPRPMTVATPMAGDYEFKDDGYNHHTATIKSPYEVVFESNSVLKLESGSHVVFEDKAWGRFLTPADIAACNKNGSIGLEIQSDQYNNKTYARFATNDEIAIGLGVPYDVAGGDVYLDKVTVFYDTTDDSSFISSSQIWRFYVSGGAVTKESVVTGSTAGSGDSNPGSFTLSLPGGKEDMSDGGLQMEITPFNVDNANGKEVWLTGILLEGHTE